MPLGCDPARIGQLIALGYLVSDSEAKGGLCLGEHPLVRPAGKAAAGRQVVLRENAG